MKLSVLICTHDPAPVQFAAVIAGLQAQSLGQEEWELIVIDNASRPGAVGKDTVTWHPSSRVVREPELGLTAARLRGIAEAQADLLVFVDDDNHLHPSYLEQAWNIAQAWPQIGAFGGQLFPLYEAMPDSALRPHVDLFFSRTLSRAAWSNVGGGMDATPVGAGMCVRRNVAERYRVALVNNPLRQALDRRGASLASCGDIDLAWTSNDCGLGTGVFPELKLDHLIAAHRTKLDYLLRLAEEIARSNIILHHVRGLRVPSASRSDRLFAIYRHWRMPPLARAFAQAEARGRRRAWRELQNA